MADYITKAPKVPLELARGHGSRLFMGTHPLFIKQNVQSDAFNLFGKSNLHGVKATPQHQLQTKRLQAARGAGLHLI
jgi:hypothetical protein